VFLYWSRIFRSQETWILALPYCQFVVRLRAGPFLL
jgi:hypothetical protein